MIDLESINKTRNGFENSFSESNYYNIQTQDNEHLNKIMKSIDIKDSYKVLDLGTGSGYISFAIAESSPNCQVIGLDIVVARYALHHFPEIKKSFNEISRVLKPGGQLFISDPTPDEYDKIHFIDRYMQMKDDGHIKFYTKDEFNKLANSVGLKLESSFTTKIRFPRKETDDYIKIKNGIDERIIKNYNIESIEREIFITEKVLNLSYRKSDFRKQFDKH